MISAVPGELTARQREILDWLGRYVIDKGYAPTYSEVARAFGMKCHSTAQHHMGSLRQLGWIRWTPGRSNTLQFFCPDGTWSRFPPPKVL
jgi:repressor LexA